MVSYPFPESVVPQKYIGHCFVFINLGNLFSSFGLCCVSSLTVMNFVQLLSEYLAVLKCVCVCVCVFEVFHTRTYEKPTYIGEKVGNLSPQKSKSWQPRGYFPCTLVEIGPFHPSVYFPHRKNKNSSFVRFTLSLAVRLCPLKSRTTH